MTFKKIITLNNEGLENGILLAKVTENQYKAIKDAYNEFQNSTNFNGGLLSFDAITAEEVYENESEIEVSEDNIDDLKPYSGIDGMEVDMFGSSLYIKYPNKYVSGCLNADESIDISELDDFFQAEHYCNICLMEVEIDEKDNCINCGNSISLEILEKDEQINDLAFENKNMASVLELLGFTSGEITEICQNGAIPTLHKEKLVSINDVNAGVNVTCFGSTELKEMSEATFTECPVCNSKNITYDSRAVDLEGDFVYRMHTCDDCGAVFDERYDLAQIDVKDSNCNLMSEEGRKSILADKLLKNSEIVFDTSKHTVYLRESSNGFDLDIYPLGTDYNTDFEFEKESLDGGIVQDGDCLDAINYAFDF